MHEFAYFSIGGLPTKSGSTASAASQYSLRDLHVNIMLNPHAATQVRMSSYERQAGSNPKVRVADQPPTGLRHAVLGYFVFMLRIPHRLRGLAECDLRRLCQTEQLGRQRVESQEDRRGVPHLCRDCGCIVEGRFQRRIGIEPSTY